MSNDREPTPERRREPRVDLLADLQGHVITLDEKVQVKQLSLGGMTVETTAPLSPREPHDFRISLGEDAITVHGRIVHSRVAIRGDMVSYVAGIEFVAPAPAARAAIQRMLDDAQGT